MPGSVSSLPTTHQVRPWERFALGGLVVAVAAVMGFAALAREKVPTEADASIAAAESAATERATNVDGLLDRWAAAVRAGDEQAVASLIDPAADPSFREQQINRAQWAAAVPFAEFGYELAAETVESAPAEIAEKYPDVELWAPTVYLSHAIVGADERPTRQPLSLLVGQRGDQWTLIADGPAADGDDGMWRGPWDFGPIVSTTAATIGGESVILSHPGSEAISRALADDLGGAINHVSSVWGDQWAQRAVVIVTNTQEEFTALVGAGYDGANVAAVAVSDSPSSRGEVPSGQRIVFSPSASERLDAQELAAVLRHELTHIAARGVTVDGSPMWILEGYAEYVAHRDDPRSARAIAPELAGRVDVGDFSAVVPSVDDFSGESAALAYERAWSMATFVAQRFGEPQLTALYRALAGGPKTDAEVDAAVQSVLAVGTEALLAEWTQWAPGQFR